MRKITLIMILFIYTLILAEEISLEQAKSMALDRNSELLAEKSSRDAAKWSRNKAFLSLIPTAELKGDLAKYDPEIGNQFGQMYDETRSYGYSITQPIFNGGAVFLGSMIENDLANIAKINYHSKRISVLTEVESKYFSVLEQFDLMEIARKDLLSSEINLEIAKIRFESGNLSNAEYLQLQSQLAQKEVSYLQLKNVYEISRMDFANFLKIEYNFELEELRTEDYTGEISFLNDYSVDEIDKVIQSIEHYGVKTNPSLKLAEYDKKINKKSVLMAGGSFLPKLNLNYSKTWSKSNLDNDYSNQGVLMLMGSIPIFPIADNVSGYKKAKYELKKSKYSYEAAEDGIRLGIKSAFYNLITSTKTIKSSKIALDYAQETYNQMESRFTNNLVSATELLDVEIMLTSSKNQYIKSFYDYLRSRSDLLQLIGEEDMSVLLELLEYK